MSFIRAKEIPRGSGNWYDYEVETIHKGDKVIQRHIRYIGKSELRASRSSGSGGVVGTSQAVASSVLISPAKPHRITKMKTPAKEVIENQ